MKIAIESFTDQPIVRFSPTICLPLDFANQLSTYLRDEWTGQRREFRVPVAGVTIKVLIGTERGGSKLRIEEPFWDTGRKRVHSFATTVVRFCRGLDAARATTYAEDEKCFINRLLAI